MNLLNKGIAEAKKLAYKTACFWLKPVYNDYHFVKYVTKAADTRA